MTTQPEALRLAEFLESKYDLFHRSEQMQAAAKLLQRRPFLVEPNEASTLFRKLTKSLMIDGLTFHDSRATALTLLSKKVDVMTLARISRHKDINLLFNTYYRASTDEIAQKI